MQQCRLEKVCHLTLHCRLKSLGSWVFNRGVAICGLADLNRKPSGMLVVTEYKNLR